MTETTPPVRRDPSMPLVKTRRRFRRWRQITWRTIIGGLSDPAQINAALLAAAGSYVVIQDGLHGGLQEMSNLLSTAVGALSASAIAAGFFIAANLIAAAFKVREDEKNEGYYSGNHYIFREPKLVFTTHVSNADNDKEFEFTVEDAEPNGSVDMNIAIDGFDRRHITVCLVNEYFKDLSESAGKSPYQHFVWAGMTRYMLAKSRKFYLKTACTTPNTSIVKVYLISWCTR